MTLDPVLPKVMADTWDADKADEVMAAFEKDYRDAEQACSNRDAAEGVKKLAAVLAEQPEVGGIPYLFSSRLQLLVKAEKFDEVEALATTAVTKAMKRDDTGALSAVASVLAGTKGRPELVKLALKAADANLQIAGDDSLSALMSARGAYAAAGEKEKAKGFADKAIAAAEKAVTGDDDVSGLMRLVSLCQTAGEADKARGFAVRAVPAAEKAVKGDKDWQGNLRLAGVYKAAGDADKAKAAAQKALDNAPEAAQRMVAQQARPYGAVPKKPDDK